MGYTSGGKNNWVPIPKMKFKPVKRSKPIIVFANPTSLNADLKYLNTCLQCEIQVPVSLHIMTGVHAEHDSRGFTRDIRPTTKCWTTYAIILESLYMIVATVMINVYWFMNLNQPFCAQNIKFSSHFKSPIVDKTKNARWVAYEIITIHRVANLSSFVSLFFFHLFFFFFSSSSSFIKIIVFMYLSFWFVLVFSSLVLICIPVFIAFMFGMSDA